MAPFEQVVERLQGVRRTGDRATALCPSHDDSDPSLSVAVADDGRVLLCCHAGCPTERVVESIGFEMSDLFPTNGGRRTDRPEASTVVERYVYESADREPVMAVVRRHPKAFHQDRPDGSGGWIPGLDGVRERPLYRLPTVLEAVAAGDTIYVVEGEKDVHALEATGCTATTNPGGAGKWKQEHTRALRGASVVVIADRDEPGRAHARTVASRLDGVADQVRAVEPTSGKDIAEHLANGLGLDDLADLPANTRPDEAAVGSGLQRLSWEVVFDGSAAGPEWLAEPLIPLGRHVAVYGQAKTGKSLLLLDIAAALAAGRPTLHQQAGPPRTVLYLDYEMAISDLYERLMDLDYQPEDLARLHYCQMPSLDPLDTEAGGAQLVESVEALRPDLVVIDTMSKAVAGDEDRSDTYRRFYQSVCLPLRRLGTTLVRVDHAGKDARQGQRGSSAKNDDVDLVWRLTRARTAHQLRIEATHSRLPWIHGQHTITRAKSPLVHAIDDGPGQTPESDEPEVRELAEELRRLGVRPGATIDEATQALRDNGTPRRRALITAARKLL